MEIYIHKDVVGFSQHLLVTQPLGELRRVSGDPPLQSLVYGTEELLEVAKLYNLTLPTFPPQNYVKAFQAALKTRDVSQVPWKVAMPPSAFLEAVRGLGRDLVNLFSGVDLTYYQDHFRKTSQLLSKMRRAKIDPLTWKFHSMDQDLLTPHVFKTFEPDEDGFAGEVVYSKSETRTGRLTVTQGPNILLLPKVQRNILGSRFGKSGKVWSLDYSSLEPRVVLYLREKGFPHPPSFGNPPRITSPDVYAQVLTQRNLTTVTRDHVKRVVLSQLYGASQETLLADLEGVKDAYGFIDLVNDFFGITELKDKLINEWEGNNREFILSHYGKRIEARDAQPYKLLNYHVQPTAVDLALYGFDAILRKINTPYIIPLFLLHDALILDVHNDWEEELQHLCEVGSKDIPMFPYGVFPIKPSRF